MLRIFFSVFQGYFKGQNYFMALNNKKPVKLWQELVWYGMETFGAWKKLNFKGQKSLEFSRRVAMCCKCITTADHLSVVDMGSNLITKCKYRTKLKLDSCHNSQCSKKWKKIVQMSTNSCRIMYTVCKKRL